MLGNDMIMRVYILPSFREENAFALALTFRLNNEDFAILRELLLLFNFFLLGICRLIGSRLLVIVVVLLLIIISSSLWLLLLLSWLRFMLRFLSFVARRLQ